MLTPFFKTNVEVVNMKNHTPTPYDFYIGRPSVVGNPYSHSSDSKLAKFIVPTRDEAIESYEKYMMDKIESNDEEFMGAVDEMFEIYKDFGKLNLCCWCKPKKCHGDYIKKYLDKRIQEIKKGSN